MINPNKSFKIEQPVTLKEPIYFNVRNNKYSWVWEVLWIIAISAISGYCYNLWVESFNSNFK